VSLPVGPVDGVTIDGLLYNYCISCSTNFTGEAKNSFEKAIQYVDAHKLYQKCRKIT